jgi:dipeptidyl aminopeptidase/acylaminoacyl peptidase
MNLVADLKSDAPLRTRAGRRFGPGQGLVVSQVAVSLVLVVGGALLARSLSVARDIDPGFDATALGLVQMDTRTAATSRLIAGGQVTEGAAWAADTSDPQYPGSWSPDGSRFVYLSPGGPSGVSLMVVRTSGEATPEVLKTGVGGEVPVWSPDGQWIKYLAQDGSHHLTSPDGSQDLDLGTSGAPPGRSRETASASLAFVETATGPSCSPRMLRAVPKRSSAPRAGRSISPVHSTFLVSGTALRPTARVWSTQPIAPIRTFG